MNDCIFCKIIKGEIPCYKIYEDQHALAFLDIACDCYGHTLVIPKQHCTNVLDCNEQSLQGVISAVQKVANHFVNNCGFSGVNILNASGQSAQQSVFHLHFHVIPRKEGDNLDLWPLHGKQQLNLAEVCQHLKLN
ncbi:MAG: HIT family protein [Clostridia bacterium]|nr:HIT family protein [Clostridia bacterium]